MGNLTPYQAIPAQRRSLKLYNVKDIYRIGTLIEGLRAWNLHGSANNLQSWVNRMHRDIDNEHDAEPFGIMDWEEMEDSFERLFSRR